MAAKEPANNMKRLLALALLAPAAASADYLGVLIGLTGKSLHELRNRYRVNFDRAPGEHRGERHPAGPLPGQRQAAGAR